MATDSLRRTSDDPVMVNRVACGGCVTYRFWVSSAAVTSTHHFGLGWLVPFRSASRCRSGRRYCPGTTPGFQKRRRVFRVAIVYAAVAFVIVETGDLV
jgi:hypothetical protein